MPQPKTFVQCIINIMQRIVQLPNKNIEYTVKTSDRARHMRLEIYPEGICVVTVPRKFDHNLIDKFLIAKSSWIEQKIDYLSKIKFSPGLLPKNLSRRDYLRHKETARVLVKDRLKYFNQFYNLKWGRVSIRDSKSRWGSCSKRSNLNFSYKLALLPQELADYVIVHELCHLQEFNHSQKFWQLVSQTIPDWKQRRKQLKFL